MSCAILACWMFLLLWRQALIVPSCLLSVAQCSYSMLAIAGWTFRPPIVTWALQETKPSCCTQSWLNLVARSFHSWPVWFGSDWWTNLFEVNLSVSIALSKIASILRHQHHFNDFFVVIKERFSQGIIGRLGSCFVIKVELHEFLRLYDLVTDCASYDLAFGYFDDGLLQAWSLGWIQVFTSQSCLKWQLCLMTNSDAYDVVKVQTPYGSMQYFSLMGSLKRRGSDS